jgi:hypothetical protein
MRAYGGFAGVKESEKAGSGQAQGALKRKQASGLWLSIPGVCSEALIPFNCELKPCLMQIPLPQTAKFKNKKSPLPW